jgi:hypothetical protein
LWTRAACTVGIYIPVNLASLPTTDPSSGLQFVWADVRPMDITGEPSTLSGDRTVGQAMHAEHHLHLVHARRDVAPAKCQQACKCSCTSSFAQHKDMQLHGASGVYQRHPALILAAGSHVPHTLVWQGSHAPHQRGSGCVGKGCTSVAVQLARAGSDQQ